MTQVPEYLLERSRARRAALGLGPADGDAAPASAPSEAPPAAPPGDSPAGGPAASAAPAVADAAVADAPVATATATPTAPAEPLPDYLADPGPKSGIPYWIMPILLLLPLWGILYLGAFGERQGAELTPEALGAQVYARNCASCHGASGEGGVGPPVRGGEARITFPNEEDHIRWVENGSQSVRGQPYGDPARAGGQRIAQSGGMPGFSGQLTPEQIAAVVLHERQAL